MFLYVRNERCGEVEREKNYCVNVSTVVSPPCSPGVENGGKIQAFGAAENVGSSADSFSRRWDLFRGSLVGWQRAFLQKNRPSDT